jgi:hypothetical protein
MSHETTGNAAEDPAVPDANVLNLIHRTECRTFQHPTRAQIPAPDTMFQSHGFCRRSKLQAETNGKFIV